MRPIKKLSVLVAVLALSAIGAAYAPAASFTASATGEITGKALETQVWTTNAGQIKCATAATSGKIESLSGASQHVTVKYSNCTAFGLGGVHVTADTMTETPGGTRHYSGNVVVISTLGGCSITFKAQSLGNVDYANSGANNIKVTPTINGLHYVSSGGLCGSGTSSNGTFRGASEWSRVGGGTLRFHP